MDPLVIAQLALIAEQLITNGITAYKEFEAQAAASGVNIKPIEDVLASADSKFDAIINAAQP